MSPYEDFNTSRNSPGRTDSQRQADALEKIATGLDLDREQRDRVENTIDDFVRRETVAMEKIAQALEAIAQHLAPVAVNTVDPDDVRVTGARVRDKASGDQAHVVGIDGPDRIIVRWVYGATGTWPAAAFERVQE